MKMYDVILHKGLQIIPTLKPTAFRVCCQNVAVTRFETKTVNAADPNSTPHMEGQSIEALVMPKSAT